MTLNPKPYHEDRHDDDDRGRGDAVFRQRKLMVTASVLMRVRVMVMLLGSGACTGADPFGTLNPKP